MSGWAHSPYVCASFLGVIQFSPTVQKNAYLGQLETVSESEWCVNTTKGLNSWINPKTGNKTFKWFESGSAWTTARPQWLWYIRAYLYLSVLLRFHSTIKGIKYICYNPQKIFISRRHNCIWTDEPSLHVYYRVSALINSRNHIPTRWSARGRLRKQAPLTLIQSLGRRIDSDTGATALSACVRGMRERGVRENWTRLTRSLTSQLRQACIPGVAPGHAASLLY